MKTIRIHSIRRFPSGTDEGMTDGSPGFRIIPVFLFVILIALSTLILLSPEVKAQEPTEEEEEVPDPTMDDVIEEITHNVGLIIFGIIGIISLIAYIPIGIKASHIRNMEDALPEVLNEIAENIRSGRSVESAFKEVADVQNVGEYLILGKEIQHGEVGYHLNLIVRFGQIKNIKDL